MKFLLVSALSEADTWRKDASAALLEEIYFIQISFP